MHLPSGSFQIVFFQVLIDQDPIGNLQSWMTSVESATQVAENIRINAPDKYEFILREMARQYMLRDGMINYIIDNADDIYTRIGPILKKKTIYRIYHS